MPQEEKPHQFFTARPTAYLRNVDPSSACVAVYYQPAPVKTEAGTVISLNCPLLIVSDYFGDQEGIAERVASILNEHWDKADG